MAALGGGGAELSTADILRLGGLASPDASQQRRLSADGGGVHAASDGGAPHAAGAAQPGDHPAGAGRDGGGGSGTLRERLVGRGVGGSPNAAVLSLCSLPPPPRCNFV